MSTQSSRILAHLRSGKSITPLQALKQYGVLRLGARVYDLRKHFIIHSDIVKVGRKRVSMYWMPRNI